MFEKFVNICSAILIGTGTVAALAGTLIIANEVKKCIEDELYFKKEEKTCS